MTWRRSPRLVAVIARWSRLACFGQTVVRKLSLHVCMGCTLDRRDIAVARILLGAVDGVGEGSAGHQPAGSTWCAEQRLGKPGRARNNGSVPFPRVNLCSIEIMRVFEIGSFVCILGRVAQAVNWRIVRIRALALGEYWGSRPQPGLESCPRDRIV